MATADTFNGELFSDAVDSQFIDHGQVQGHTDIPNYIQCVW